MIDVIKAIREAASRETRSLPITPSDRGAVVTLRAPVGSCGRFILGSESTPSRLCGNAKIGDQPFCRSCSDYVRGAMHRAIPDHWVREINRTM